MRIFKKVIAGALLLALAVGGINFGALTMRDAKAEESGEAGQLFAPRNVRKEQIRHDGAIKDCIVWDEMEEAYGYTVRARQGDEEVSAAYYENFVEWKRFFYEHNMDFGDYTFEVCAFDEAGNSGEWSAPAAVSYAPTFEVSLNVRLSEDGGSILWDEADGAARYNIVIKNASGVYYGGHVSGGSSSIWWSDWLWDSGDYSFAIQAMDGDYNVSAWSEPVEVSYTEDERFRLETPQNVRLDESGNKVLWDAVEGATYYIITVASIETNSLGYTEWIYGNDYVYVSDAEELQYNWKSLVYPILEGCCEITIQADGWHVIGSDVSDPLTVDFTPTRDESIGVPENVWLENGLLCWDEIENAERYWPIFSLYSEDGELIYSDGGGSYASTISNNDWIDAIRLPAGACEAEIFVVDENGNFNSKKYPVTIDTVPDESVWVPKLFYKFDELLWDWDTLRHGNTDYFWLRLSKGGDVIRLEKRYGSYWWMGGLENGKYTVEVCAAEYNDYKIGNWTSFTFEKHEGGLFDEENESTTEVEKAPEAAEVPESDRITSITVNPAFNMKNKDDESIEFDLTNIRIKAKEIYDEEGLKRAEEALGKEIVGNQHYNLLDLTLWEGERDISNAYDGLVQVIISLPEGHRDKTFSCYRLTEVDGKMTKEVIPGEQTEDSYIIYLEHFSQYALVADGGEEEHTHAYGDGWQSDRASHWHECACGEKTETAAHTAGEWTVDSEAGLRYRDCAVCGARIDEEPLGQVDDDPTQPDDNKDPAMGAGFGLTKLRLLGAAASGFFGACAAAFAAAKRKKKSQA